MFLDKINEVLASKKSFVSDRTIFTGLVLSTLSNIIHWVVLLFKIKPSGQNILLHYNVIYGSDFVEKSSYAYLIPITALLILIVNFFIASRFYKREKTAAYFLVFGTMAVQLVFFAASLVLIVANE